MRLSNGVEWALHCCVTLSQSAGPVPAGRLAHLHGIPPAYLAKHLQALSRASVVRSVPGQVGGYALTRAAREITVLQVVEAIDGTGPAFRCTEIRRRGPLGAAPEQCVEPCAIARVMATAERARRDVLHRITIEDIVATVDSDTEGAAMANLRDWLSTG